MIVVTVHLWPKGDAANAQHLGTAVITNDGSGTERVGNYEFRLSKWGKPGEDWKRGTIKDFPRKALGPWDLLGLGLCALLNSRWSKFQSEVKRILNAQ